MVRRHPALSRVNAGVFDVVKRDAYNGVVVIVPLGTESRETYVPGYVSSTIYRMDDDAANVPRRRLR